MELTLVRQYLVPAALFAAAFVLPGAAQADEQEWSFTAAPYFFMSGLKGDTAPFSGLPPVSVDASFSDIFDTLRMAFLISGEARKGRFALVADLQYYDLEANAETPGNLYSEIALGTKLNVFTGGGAYRLASNDKGFLDGIASLRYTSVDTSLSFYEGLLPTLSASAKESWLDPLVGVKGRMEFSDRWAVTGWALFTVGGDSDSNTDLFLALNYRMTENWQAQLGYRQMDTDYAKDGFVYDMVQSGPMLGVSYSF